MKWYIRIDVATAGGNTTFTVLYSTASTGPFSYMLSDTVATPTDPVAIGMFLLSLTTAATQTTGQHIGALTVQDLPALSAAAISGPTQQAFGNPAMFTVVLDSPAGSGGVVVTIASSNGSDTFQATQGGTNLSPKQITVPQSSVVGTFWLTPGGAIGNRTISITTSPALTISGSLTYNALGPATSFTVTGASGGHQLVPGTWSVNLIGGDFTGTVTATPGGGIGQCQIFTPVVVTFVGDGTTTKPLVFTPLSVDSVTFTFTNSGSLTNAGTKSYLATGDYLDDTFSSGTGLIQSHTSDTLASGLLGSGYVAPSAGAISLDGTGGVYLSTTGTAISLSAALMPSVVSGEFVFQYNALSAPGGSAIAMIVVMASGSNTLAFGLSGGLLCWVLNGTYISSAGYATPPAVGVAWLIKLDVHVDASNSGYTDLQSQYSIDGGATWAPLITNAPNFPTPYQALTTSVPTSIAYGLYFGGPTFAAGTGPHISNVTVRDIAPAAPNASIATTSPFGVAGAYVATSGQSAVFFFVSGLTGVGTPLTPSTINAAPSFFRNGISINVGTNCNPTGVHSCAIVQFQPGIQIAAGDVVTVSTPSSWMSCGTQYAANQVTTFPIANYVGKSCFGTDTLTKTFRPGINLSDSGCLATTKYQIPMNWRYRLPPPVGGSTMTVDGYPTTLKDASGDTMTFLSMSDSSGLDATNFPGVPGMWAIGFDDNYVANSGSPTTLAIVSADSTKATVTPINSVDNPGSGGLNQYYMFDVHKANGSTTENIPISLQWANASSTPYVSNLWIVAPEDFSYTLGTPLTFDRTNPYALSGQFLARLAHGCGSMRFLDSMLSFGGETTLSEPWELHNLADFSWNNSLATNYTIGYTSARAFDPTVSPYIYSEFIGSSYNLTLNSSGDSSTTLVGTVAISITGVVTGSGTAFTTALAVGQWLSVVGDTNSGNKLYQVATITSNTAATISSGVVGTGWPTIAISAGVATAYTFSTSFSINAGGDAYAIPISMLLLTMGGSEKCRIRSVSGTANPYTCTVERGSSGTKPVVQSAGTISCAGRLNVTTISQVGNQVVEMVCQSNHNLKTGNAHTFLAISGGSYPLMTFTNGSTRQINNLKYPVQVTGPKIFVVDFLTGPSAATIGPSPTSYTLDPAKNVTQVFLPPTGFPYEFAAITAGHFPNCNIQVNIPVMASDSLCYSIANRIKAYFPSGRKVYLEIADEWWNFGQTALYSGQVMDRLLSYSTNSGYNWYVIRTSQVRTIFRTVFGGRASEIYAAVNAQSAVASMSSMLLGIASANSVLIDGVLVAPYIDPNNLSANITSWNNSSSVSQMVDLWIHDLYCKINGVAATLASHYANVQAYNTSYYTAATGTNAIFAGYEGGYESGAPAGARNVMTLNRDILYDPNYRIAEQDVYAMFQRANLMNLHLYSFGIYYSGSNDWNIYPWPYQQPGRGDGSDGLSDNRLCLATPGYANTKTSAVNQDGHNVSVRGQAFLDWLSPQASTQKHPKWAAMVF